jgi:hypothetical protein
MFARTGSSGTLPRKRMLYWTANDSPPPVLKISVVSYLKLIQFRTKEKGRLSSLINVQIGIRSKKKEWGIRWTRFVDRTLQHGQTNPLMFSIIPITERFIFIQKFSSFFTVIVDTSWGVVTMIACVNHFVFHVNILYWKNERNWRLKQ